MKYSFYCEIVRFLYSRPLHEHDYSLHLQTYRHIYIHFSTVCNFKQKSHFRARGDLVKETLFFVCFHCDEIAEGQRRKKANY